MKPINGNLQGWIRLAIQLLIIAAATVTFAFTTFETQTAHDADMEEVHQIHKDLHELLGKFGSVPSHLTK